MEEADSDALLLYDCCNAAATSTSETQHDQQGVTEAIAACGYETIAPEVGEHSFTNALIETLAASKGVPFSIGELHNRIMNRLKCWVPSLKKDGNGKMKEDAKGRLEYERQPRKTPIYSHLVEFEPRRSVLLAPLPKPSLDLRDRMNESASSPQPRNEHPTKAVSSSHSAPKRKRALSLEDAGQKYS